MANKAITDYTEKTDVCGEELLEVVDLRESAASDQNKKITIGTLLGAIVCHDDEVVIHDDEVVWD